MKKLLFVLMFVLAHDISNAFELGGLKFELGASPTVTSDVQIVGRSDGRSFIGGGVCSGYAYRINMANVFEIDILSVCAIASGTFEDEAESKFIGGPGLSPFSLFNGKLKTVFGWDFGSGRGFSGGATTMSAVVQF